MIDGCDCNECKAQRYDSLAAENAALAQQVESFTTVTDNARCQSGSEPEDLQAFIEGLWAEKAGLAQRVEQEKQRADLNESIARARDAIAAKLAQQVEELTKERALMRDATNKELGSLRENWERAERQVEELKKENAKLREAILKEPL